MQSNKGYQAVNQARKSSDNVVLAATFAVFFIITSSFFIYSFLIEASAEKYGLAELIIGLIFALIFGAIMLGAVLLLGMFLVRMQRQTMLGNSLQVAYSDYAWLRDWANEVAADIGMPTVEIFVTQDPVMNAYAFGFIRPYCIVLNSGSIRYLSKDELKVVVLHEMAHIRYKHTNALVYLTPFLVIPIISQVGSWIIGFWSRRAEWTADRLALTYLGDAEIVKMALIKIHVGPDVAEAMNQTARDWLQYTAERPMNRLAQTFSSHPFLVRRLSQLDFYAARFGIKK